MAVQLLNYTTVCCYKLLLLVLLWNEVARVNGTGSESPTHDKNNYPTVINERIKRYANTLLPGDCNNENNHNMGHDKDKQNLPFSIGYPLRELNIVKRTPSGFTGMRGKKDYEFADNNNANKQAIYDNDNNNKNNNNADWSIEPLQQAAYENEVNTAYNHMFGLGPRFKKAPSTFYGVRGKKYSSDDLQHIDTILQRLEEDNLRDVLRKDFLNYLLSERRQQVQNDVAKRAPTGFTGMRGKRPAAGVIDYLYNNGENEIWPLAMLDEKRGPVNGFMGVRGKKDVDHQAFKRSPAEAPNRRSKSQRFVDFSNKFVAVRGKKANSESSESNNNNNNNNTFDDETYARYNINNNNKIPLMSQLSVRGKRAAIAMPAETDQATYELAVEDLRTFNNN